MRTIAPPWAVLSGIVLTLVTAFALIPLAWMALGSIRPPSELLSGEPSFLPRSIDAGSFRRLAETPFGRQAVNSIGVALATAVLATAAACSTGYVLGRSRSRAAQGIGALVLTAYMVAPIMLVIPVFVLFRLLGLSNSLTGLVIAHTAYCLPFAIWSLRGFYSTLPAELEERAAADGLAPLPSLVQAVLPVAYPGLATTAVFSFVLSWNEYVFARVLVSSSSRKTVPVGVEDLFYGGHVDWGVIMAAGTCVLVPAAVVVLVLRKHLQRGWLASWQ